MKWFITHLIPRIHWSSYTRKGERYLQIWRQWLGFCWDKTEVKTG